MITTTDAPPWLRRSDQAVTWAWTCSHPTTPSSSTARPTDLPGTVRARSPIRTCRIRTRTEWAPLARSFVSKRLSVICRMWTRRKRSPSAAWFLHLMRDWVGHGETT